MRFVGVFAMLLLNACSVVGLGSYEEPAYDVTRAEDSFEIRDYKSFVVAETLVDDRFEDAQEMIEEFEIYRAEIEEFASRKYDLGDLEPRITKADASSAED